MYQNLYIEIAHSTNPILNDGLRTCLGVNCGIL